MEGGAEDLVNDLNQTKKSDNTVLFLEETRLAWSAKVPQYTPSEWTRVATALADCAWRSLSQTKACTHDMRQRLCTECRVTSQLMEILHDAIKGHTENSRLALFAKCAPCMLRYFGVFQTSSNEWCDIDTREAAEEAISHLFLLAGFSDVSNAIAKHELFQKVMDPMWSVLSRDQWKKFEAEKLVYVYMVWSSPYGVLTENLGKILPFALMMTDDIMPQNMKLGIGCLSQLLNEIPASELRLFGRAEVIHDALVKKMYTKDSHVLGVLLPSILSSLQVLETDMQKKRGCEIPNHDECFDTMLNNFHLSSDEDAKRVYAKHLPKFTEAMGIHVVGHMKKLHIVLEYGLENADQDILGHFIEMITTLSDVAWPRMIRHQSTIVKLLVTTLYRLRTDTTGRNRDGRRRNVTAINHALAKLALSSGTFVKEVLDMMGQEECLDLCADAHKIREIAKLADTA